jgi:nitrogen fixation protein NifQ
MMTAQMSPEHTRMYEDVKTLLAGYAVNGYAETVLAPLVARVSLEMNHLYEDLGFKSRTEMGQFMKKNFPELAASKPKEKLWKKYLYDRVGAIAPACATCDDQLTCFKCMVKELSA